MTRYRFVPENRPTCFFKVCEHGWEIHFGPKIQPTTAFSEIGFHKEVRYLVEEAGYVVFTEVMFFKGMREGQIIEV